MAHRRILAACAACALALVAAPAGANATAARAPAAPTPAPPSNTPRPNPLLWATVNVCDTDEHPNAIGIRGSMPGTGNPQVRMFMRFQLQYYGADRRWRATGANGDSGFIPVGSGRFRARQAGRTFTVTTPAPGARYRLRGMVTFEWRVEGEVVKRAKRRTLGSHPNTRGADPVGFSAASCVVS